MSVGSAGGLPPDSLVEQEDAILADCIRVIDRFHDAPDGAMVRRRRALFAVFGEPGPDARCRAAGAR